MSRAGRGALPVAVSLAVGAAVWLAFAPARFLNYDTAYSLLWGADLADGRSPDLGVAFAPTPKPLATLLGVLLSVPGLGDVPRGGFQETAWEVLAFLALGVLAWLVFALGRQWFGTAAGVVAAVVVLTREPVLSYGVRAYVDIPYVCLLLGALLVESRRRAAGTPVLVLVGLAGLLRPEAWLFAGAYLVWLWWGGSLRPGHVVLAAAAPALWLVHDAALTGDALHSFTGTREGAEELDRVTGIANIPETLPRRLGEIVREPVLVGAAGGGALALWRLRDRAWLGFAAGVLAVAAFCVLAAAGLPLLTRYLLLPATLLAIFCGAGVTGWALLPRDDPGRAPWIAVAVVTVLLGLVLAPQQARRLDRLQAAMATQTAILEELRSYFPVPTADGCPYALPNRRGVPQVALWSGIAPADVLPFGDPRSDDATAAFAPTSRRVAEQFVLDKRDRTATDITPRRGRPDERGRFWNVWLVEDAHPCAAP
ncbi:MAG: hypothetical protein HZB46_06100 [Solirubrobacterales bacterium]|nr:hypothetical protein [Solirubrobacterales bacterium]